MKKMLRSCWRNWISIRLGGQISFGELNFIFPSFFSLLKVLMETFSPNRPMVFCHLSFYFPIFIYSILWSLLFFLVIDWDKIWNIGVTLGQFTAWKNFRLGRAGFSTRGKYFINSAILSNSSCFDCVYYRDLSQGLVLLSFRKIIFVISFVYLN